jgi:chromosome segregation ATPase
MAKLFAYLSAIFLLGLGSCTSSVDHSEKIGSLQSLQADLLRAENDFSQIDFEETKAMFGRIEADLKAVQESYEGDMSFKLAKKLSDYREVTKMVKDFPRRYARIKSEIERTKGQLSGLERALTAKATVDSKGNEITPEYVERMYNQEQKVASSLINEIDEMCAKLKSAQTRYTDMLPQVTPILDSLGINSPE